MEWATSFKVTGVQGTGAGAFLAAGEKQKREGGGKAAQKRKVS